MRLRPLGILISLLLLAAPSAGQNRLLGFTRCCPNNLVEFDPVSGEQRVLVRVGTSTDRFIATVGSGVLDAEGDRIFMIRNNRLVTIHLENGTVDEGLHLDDVIQLLAFDPRRQQVYGFTRCCPNHLVAVDPDGQELREVAEVGTGEYVPLDVVEDYDEDGNLIFSDTSWVYQGDLFSPLSGPALTIGERVLFIRNDRLLTVYPWEGRLVEGRQLENMQMLGYDSDEDALFLFTTCCPNRILRYESESDLLSAVAEAGTAGRSLIDVEEHYDDEGNVIHRDSIWTHEGDLFNMSMGLSLFDETGDRLYLRRNDRLLSVDLESGQVAYEGEQMEQRLSFLGFGPTEGVGIEDEGPSRAEDLFRVSPNPAHAEAEVVIAVRQAERATLEVFDLLGRRIALLYEGRLAPDTHHRFDFRAGGLPSGIYLIRLSMDERITSLPLILVR